MVICFEKNKQRDIFHFKMMTLTNRMWRHEREATTTRNPEIAKLNNVNGCKKASSWHVHPHRAVPSTMARYINVPSICTHIHPPASRQCAQALVGGAMQMQTVFGLGFNARPWHCALFLAVCYRQCCRKGKKECFNRVIMSELLRRHNIPFLNVIDYSLLTYEYIWMLSKKNMFHPS